MSDTLEQELRAALAERAATLPPDAVERLSRLNYRRESRRRLSRLPGRPPLWPAVSGAAAALAAGIATAVMLLSSGATPAYAGWTPTPTTPSPAALMTTAAACKSHAGPLLRTAMRGRLVLTEQRGRYVALMYAGGMDAGVCIAGNGGSVTGGSGVRELIAAAPAPGQLGPPATFGATAPGFADSYGPAIDAYGRTGSNVVAVSFIIHGGTAVRATVQNGWYFAWWPETGWQSPRHWFLWGGASSVRVTLSSGATISSPMPVSRCREEASCVFTGFNTNSPATTTTTPAATTTTTTTTSAASTTATTTTGTPAGTTSASAG